MLQSIITHRFDMEAEVLSWEGVQEGGSETVGQGSWDTYQDPITGEILNKWVSTEVTDNPATYSDETSTHRTIRCIARGIVDGGIRVAGTTERWVRGEYQASEFIHMWVPKNVIVTQRDQITNIRWKKGGAVVWLDEQYQDNPARPTVFNVNGVTPLFDAFNNHIENYIMLERVK